MWLIHFKHKAHTKIYQRFALRYYEFRPEDCVDLCRTHHREIHRLYWRTIGLVALRLGACKKWSWQMAHDLMDQLRRECDAWLRTN
jgi:hypothetical protein